MIEREDLRESRNSKNNVLNGRGKDLLERAGEMGYIVLNGCNEWDKDGEHTFVMKNGASVIDLGFCHVNSRVATLLENLEKSGNFKNLYGILKS